MKKALALSAFALILTLPLVSSAGTVESLFLSSDSGTSTISIGQNIQFEVSVTLTSGFDIDTFFFSLSGDATTAAALGAGAGPVWAGVQGLVANWEWNYKLQNNGLGTGDVVMGTNGRIAPAFTQTLGTPVLIQNGFFGESGRTGTGVTNILGTVTITANGAGTFQGGGFEILGLDTMAGPAGADTYISNTATYTVVPEPGTALLMILGLGGLGVMGRKSRK
jgi:hypothetical protein